MKSVLLDTNSYSLYSRGNTKVKGVLVESDRVVLSTVSLGELYFGFKTGTKESENLKILESFVGDSKVVITDVNRKTATYYSEIKYVLRRKGIPIPDNDIWIVASALETKSTLITYDRHFLKIAGLKYWKELS